MSEKRRRGLLVIGGLVIGILGLLVITVIPPLFAGDLAVDSFETTLAEDGSLQEHYTYDVLSSSQYRMLYRVWAAPYPVPRGGIVGCRGNTDCNRICRTFNIVREMER